VKEVEMEDAPLPSPPVEQASQDEAASGDKRKAEEPAATNGGVAEKKAKTDSNGHAATTNGNDEPAPAPAPKKLGRPRKDKKEKPPVPIGRTIRKTRSQGPVEAKDP